MSKDYIQTIKVILHTHKDFNKLIAQQLELGKSEKEAVKEAEKQLFEKIKNEAIDNAFKEIHEDVQLIFATLDAHNKTLTTILEILNDQRQQETLTKKRD